MTPLLGWAAHLPRYRLARVDVGLRRGDRVVAAFDEDSTTMAVAASADIPVSARRPRCISPPAHRPTPTKPTPPRFMPRPVFPPIAWLSTAVVRAGLPLLSPPRAPKASRPALIEQLGGDGATIPSTLVWVSMRVVAIRYIGRK